MPKSVRFALRLAVSAASRLAGGPPLGEFDTMVALYRAGYSEAEADLAMRWLHRNRVLVTNGVLHLVLLVLFVASVKALGALGAAQTVTASASALAAVGVALALARTLGGALWVGAWRRSPPSRWWPRERTLIDAANFDLLRARGFG